MSAVNPQGEMRYWGNGSPFAGILKGTTDTGNMQYWGNGSPYDQIFPASAGGSLIKTINSVAIASVKSRNGVLTASIKTRLGVNNV